MARVIDLLDLALTLLYPDRQEAVALCGVYCWFFVIMCISLSPIALHGLSKEDSDGS